MKKKLIAFLLIFAVCFTYVPTSFNSYAEVSPLQERISKNKVALGLFVFKMFAGDYGINTEIEKISNQNVLGILKSNGFIKEGNNTYMDNDETIEDILDAVKEVILVAGTQNLVSQEVFEKNKSEAYTKLFDALPEQVQNEDFSNYGANTTQKAENLIGMAKDIYTDGNKFVEPDNEGGIKLVLPYGKTEINKILKEYSTNKDNAIQLTDDHLEAINIFLNILAQKVNNSDLARDAFDLASKLEVLKGTISKSKATSASITLGSKDKTSATLTLSATAGDAAIGCYEIYKVGEAKKIATTSARSYKVNGLTENTTYKFKIVAVDIYGLKSDASAELSVTTDKTTSTDTGGTGGGGGGGGGATTETPSTETPSTGGTTTGSTNTVEVSNTVASDAVQTTETAAKVTVQVDAAKFTAEVAKAVENLAAAVEKAAANEEVVAKIVIPIAQTTKEEVQVNIPVAALAKAMDKNVEVVFEAKGVEIAIPVQNIKTGFENVSFEMKEVKETAELVQKINQKIAQSAAGAVEVTKVAKVFTFDLTGTNSAGETERLDKSFDKKVKVTMDISDVAVNKDKAVLKYVDNDGNTSIVGKKIKDGKITAHLSHFSSYALMEREVTLKDISSHWAKDAINSMASKDVVKGYEDMTFKPENKVTRAEFAKLVVEALELDIVKSTDTFKDTKGHWGADYIATAYKNSIISGYDKDTFKPNAQITRAEMAVMLSRALGSADAKADLGKFTDSASIPAWAQAGVKGAVAWELMKGDANGKFNPQNQTTRAESATVIYRLFNK